ncbi:MAG: T9SS type A sorting domain-containing protein [Saprospiraceae bacterium]|nr:T9SS type A sorting domain-containing protein [Saprospiraceae bacterium]
MKKIIIFFVFVFQISTGFAQSSYDISFTGGQWEDANGVIINPSGGTGCLTTIYNSLLVQVAGGGFGPPGAVSYPLSNGGATIVITAVDATILALPSGSFAGYFTWSLVGNILTGVQNSAIPMDLDIDDPLNGINGGRIVFPIETPNMQNQMYTVNAEVTHPNPTVYNSSTTADTEDNNGQNNQDCILPITLMKFDAKNVNETAILTWQSAEEVNASHFEIQRSQTVLDGNERGQTLDNFNLQSLGEVPVSGNRKEYSFVDNRPLSGLNYYRLKMVDLDGSFSYSPIKAVEFKSLPVDVYPNPFQDNVVFDLNGNYDLIKIVNGAGSLVKSIGVKGQNRYQMDMTDINSGIYFAELIGSRDSDRKMFKLVKIAE